MKGADGKHRLPDPDALRFARLALVASAVSGLTSMTYQIAWTRALVMSLGSTTYSFTCILSAFILGIGLGSVLIAKYADRIRRPTMMLGLFEFGIGLAAAVLLPIHGYVPMIARHVVIGYHEHYGSLLAINALLIFAVTVVPTLLMGMAFPLMTRIAAPKYTSPGEAIGRVYVINTCGTIIGAVLTGFVLIRGDVLGVRATAAIAALANGVIGVWLLAASAAAGRETKRAVGAGAFGLVVVGAAGLFVGPWDLALMSSTPFRGESASVSGEQQLLFYREDVDMTVSVQQFEKGYLVLKVNGKPDASTGLEDVRTQILLGHLPALLDKQPRRACIVGLGSGMTLQAVANHPEFERIDCVELSSAVIAAAEYFGPCNGDILHRGPPVRMIRGDGRNHLLLTDETYDLIISEPSNPWISGVSTLFTREFFEICKRKLSPQGHLTVWMHAYSMAPEDFRMVVRTLTEVFGYTTLWEMYGPDYCLVAGDEPFRVPARTVLDRCAGDAVRVDLYRTGVRDAAGMVGLFVAGGERLRAWAAGGRLHTDDNSILEFSAPRHLYSTNAMSIAKDLAAIQQIPFDEVIECGAESDDFRSRVEKSIASRQIVGRSEEMFQQGWPLEALDSLIRVYEADPGNVPLYQRMLRIRKAIEADAEIPADSAQSIQEWLKRLAKLPQPIVVAPQATSLADAARSIQSLAVKYRESDPKLELYYLDEACRLAPDDGLLAASRVLSLRSNGHTEQAGHYLAAFLRAHPNDGWICFAAGVAALAEHKKGDALGWFRRVLDSGVVTARQLEGDSRVESLRNDPDFKAMIEGYDASHPER